MHLEEGCIQACKQYVEPIETQADRTISENSPESILYLEWIVGDWSIEFGMVVEVILDA